MKVAITKDMINGEESKAVDIHLDELDMHGLRMLLTNPGVASITITRKDILRVYAKHGKKDES